MKKNLDCVLITVVVALAFAYLPTVAGAQNVGDIFGTLQNDAINSTNQDQKTALDTEQARRAEWDRRNAKYADKPHTRLPWCDMKIYEKPDYNSRVIATIPASVDLIVIEKAWWAKVYCPSMDVEGWFDTMYLCQFKGQPTVTINLNDAYAKEQKLFEESLKNKSDSTPATATTTSTATTPATSPTAAPPTTTSSTIPPQGAATPVNPPPATTTSTPAPTNTSSNTNTVTNTSGVSSTNIANTSSSDISTKISEILQFLKEAFQKLKDYLTQLFKGFTNSFKNSLEAPTEGQVF